MNKDNLIDNHIKFISLNPWLNDIDFNNIDIIECKSRNLYFFIRSLIEYKVIQCNILIDRGKNRFYYNGNHYFNKFKHVSYNNRIEDYLIDSEGNGLFSCEDKYGLWGDNEYYFKPYDYFDNEEVNKEDLILTYNE